MVRHRDGLPRASKLKHVTITTENKLALEKVIRNRGKSIKTNLDSEDDGERCETHSTLVCRDCTVIEHPVSSCKVIPIKEHF